MRNMRNIRIRIRDIVSGLHTLLLFLLDISLGELDEFLTFSVHPRVVLVTIFVANPTLDVWPFCI
jgi:ABC-type sulfate transport system permease subunit